jgi:hypothetical protein
MKSIVFTFALVLTTIAAFANNSNNQLPVADDCTIVSTLSVEFVSPEAIQLDEFIPVEGLCNSEFSTDANDVAVKNRVDRLAELSNPLYTSSLLA